MEAEWSGFIFVKLGEVGQVVKHLPGTDPGRSLQVIIIALKELVLNN